MRILAGYMQPSRVEGQRRCKPWVGGLRSGHERDWDGRLEQESNRQRQETKRNKVRRKRIVRIMTVQYNQIWPSKVQASSVKRFISTSSG